MTLDIQGLTTGLIDQGVIVVDPFTGMPASGPGAELSPEDFAAQQSAARGELSSIGAPFNLSAWLQQNKAAVYLGSGALVLMAMFGGRRR